jgi:hypothetical protein
LRHFLDLVDIRQCLDRLERHVRKSKSLFLASLYELDDLAHLSTDLFTNLA